jgi:hypothetical protein
MKSIIFGLPPCALTTAGGGFECMEVALEGVAVFYMVISQSCSKKDVKHIEREQMVQCRILKCVEIENVLQYKLDQPIKFRIR